LYHRLGVVTVYGFIRARFGALAQRATALLFVVGRLLASGVRLYIAGLAFSAVTGQSLFAAIALCGALAAAYTMVGGIRAVVWTDVLQGIVLCLGACAVLATLGSADEGGIRGIAQWAAESDRMRVVSLPHFAALAEFFAEARGFWVALLGGCFLTLATHATDHDMVQRLLTTRDGEGGGRALVASGLVNFPLTALFLLIGTGLAWFYAEGAVPYDISDSKQILPLFALHELPAGARGLVFAGLFAAAMSSLDSAICAITTTVLSDLRRPTTAAAPDRRQVWRGSILTSAALVGVAVAMAHYAECGLGGEINLVELALSAMTIVYGGLLGVFSLGLLTKRRGSEASVLSGLAVGAGAGALLFLQVPILGALGFPQQTAVAWPWWIPIAASLAFAVAAAGGPSSRGCAP
jgi:Na+/proline symporter